MGKNYFIIPIFVPHLGCPHNCVFCNQKRITGLSTDVSSNYVKNKINSHLATFPKDISNIEVAFYGGSFTGIDLQVQKDLLSIPLKFKNEGKIDGIRISTRPDYIDKEILDILKEYRVDTIELGVQSFDDNVLYKNERGHTPNDVHKASSLIKEYGFNLGLQMMIGLIGDSREKSIFTAKEFIKLNPYCVRIYPTLIIKDTFLEKIYKTREYNPLSLDEAIEISVDLLMLFEYNNINVIRIGLQPTDTIAWGKDIVAGPFHPAFRQLVESQIYGIILNNYLDMVGKDKIISKIITIETNEKNISNIAGQNACNIKYLINKFKPKKIKFVKECFDVDVLNIYIDNNFNKIDRKKAIETYLRGKYII